MLRIGRMKISAIIVNYNSGDYLLKCIASLQKFLTNDFDEIIVVDNDSNDDSFVKLMEREDVKCIELHDNRGYGGGCNVGFRESNGDVLLFLNPDVILQAPIDKIVSIFSKVDDCAIVTPAIYETDGTYSGGDSCRAFPTLIRDAIEEFKYIAKTRKQANQYLSQNSTFYEGFSCGCALFVRREAFQKAGGFDEGFFLYYEEVDLFKRLHDYGYRFVHEPSCSVKHIGSGSSGDLDWRYTAIRYNSKLRYWMKHKSIPTVLIHRTINAAILVLKILVTLMLTRIDGSDARANKIQAYFYALKIYLMEYSPWDNSNE